ncbi:MAG: Holliday junction resolvase RuvX [Solirubrobacterales bacterium]|nr:Holliday junction resolvase RuvX [Solirubrobacterales bacterium]
MRVLALDYGTARIGCAISDPTGTLATPIAAIEPPEVAEVVRVAGEREAEKIVVGLPVSLSGSDSGQTELTRSFATDLGEAVEVPVETWDERFTTRMAAQTRRETGAGSAEDSIAAAHLLESYLLAASSRENADGEEAGQ